MDPTLQPPSTDPNQQKSKNQEDPSFKGLESPKAIGRLIENEGL
jgi:hypothetical protein